MTLTQLVKSAYNSGATHYLFINNEYQFFRTHEIKFAHLPKDMPENMWEITKWMPASWSNMPPEVLPISILIDKIGIVLES